MHKPRRGASLCTVVVLIIILVGLGAAAQRQKVAVFVQAAAAVPAADLDVLKNYTYQQCAVVTGAEVAGQGELMYAQRLTDTYIGNSVTVEGMQRLAQTLNVQYIVILRIVRWENKITYRPERSLLLIGAASLFDSTIQLLVSPIGVLFGLEKNATVGLVATVFTPQGDIRFSTAVTEEDRPLLSILTADPLEAAKEAVDSALYQVAVAL